MTEDCLLVLGASDYQLDVVRAAQDRGIRVVVADNVPTNPGHRLADASYLVSTRDVDAIERVARSESVQGIVAPCTDVAVPTAAIVAERLGLPGPPPLTANLLTTKSEFRRWQRERQLPSPHTYPVNGSTSSRPRGRVVVKPDRSSGSKGIRIVKGAGDGLDEAISAARTFDDDVVVEEFLEGHQLTVEGLVREGRLAWSLVLDRQTAPAPWCATTGHRLPTTLMAAEAARAVGAVAETVQAIGLEEGPVDADLVSADDPVVLELSPRLGGNEIASLARLATGVNLAGAAIDAALGLPTLIPDHPAPSPSAVILLGTDRAGRLAYDQGEAKALSEEPWVARLELDPPGTLGHPFVEGRAAVGRALITAPDRRGIDARAEEVVARIGVRAL